MEDRKLLLVALLAWLDAINESDPMRLETDNDDIAEMFLEDWDIIHKLD